MERRGVLKLLASAAAVQALSPDAFSLFRQVHAQIAQAPGLRTLSPHQDATVATISDLIIPQTDTPGAKAVKVDQFIDLILTEWFDAPNTARFLAGLADVDARSQKLFQKNFIDCAESEQKQILQVLDEQAFLAAPPIPNARPVPNARDGGPPSDPFESGPFFGMMKKLTLVGYYTSEVGFEDELHDSIIPPTHAGCPPLPVEDANR